MFFYDSIPFHIIAKMSFSRETNKSIVFFIVGYMRYWLFLHFQSHFIIAKMSFSRIRHVEFFKFRPKKRATDARLTLGVRHLRHGTFPIVGASVTLSVYPRLDVPICIIMWRMTSNHPESDMSNSSRFKKSRLEPWIMINVGRTLEKSSGKGLQLLLCPWVVRNNFAH